MHFEAFKRGLRRCREQLWARPFIVANVLLGRDVFRLLPPQRERFVVSAGLDRPILVPPKAIQLGMTGRLRRRSMVISFTETKTRVRPLATMATFAFIDEIVRLRKRLQETGLYRLAMSGEKIRRQFSVNGHKRRGQLVSEEDLRRYFERCRTLVASIENHGVVSISSSKGSKFRNMDGDDKDIGIMINEEGSLIHYRRGKHRLAIAQSLELERVPVVIHFISGPYLLKFIRRRDVLWPGQLLKGIRQAVDQAVFAAETAYDSKTASLSTEKAAAPLASTA